jgi:hypothetical protein
MIRPKPSPRNQWNVSAWSPGIGSPIARPCPWPRSRSGTGSPGLRSGWRGPTQIVGRVETQPAPGRHATSNSRLACIAPATSPVDVPELRTQRCGAGSLTVSFRSHPSALRMTTPHEAVPSEYLDQHPPRQVAALPRLRRVSGRSPADSPPSRLPDRVLPHQTSRELSGPDRPSPGITSHGNRRS